MQAKFFAVVVLIVEWFSVPVNAQNLVDFLKLALRAVVDEYGIETVSLAVYWKTLATSLETATIGQRGSIAEPSFSWRRRTYRPAAQIWDEPEGEEIACVHG